MQSIHPTRPAHEAFYRYNLVSGAYDYVIPPTDAPNCLFLHDCLQHGGDRFLEQVHPDDHLKIKAHFKQLERTRPDQAHETGIEYRLRMKDGGYRWFQDRHALVFAGDAHPLGVVGSIRDVTTEKEAETTLQSYAHIVSVSSDYLALIDRKYIYRAISAAYAQTLQEKREQLLGRSVSDIMGPETFGQILKPMADRCFSGETVNFELWHSFPNGRRRLLDIKYTPHFEKGRKPKTISAYVERARDITDIAKLEEQLRQSCKLEAIGMLTGNIAHDFNNILSAIVGYSEISLQMIPTDSELHGYLQRILGAGNRAADLVKQILNFSRKGERDVRPVHIKHIVDELLTLIRATFPANIRIVKELQSDALVMCDATQIYQILLNLCSNAGYAMREKGGILRVSLADIDLDAFLTNQTDIPPGRYIKISVSDTGTGMTAEVQKRILDPFFTTKEKGKGTGIGLSLTYDIIKSYGGTLNVHSAPGMGSTFSVFLPTMDGQHLFEAETTAALPTGRERILFIDDEDTLADLGKQMIESLGYQVTSRVNSVEALSLFRNDPEAFDLVITDLVMPDLAGDELVRRIRTIRADIPVILVTGFTEQMTPEKAASLGVSKLAIKPIVMKDMARFIRAALSPSPSGDDPRYPGKNR
jgi:PAS domain S-box-containing protein